MTEKVKVKIAAMAIARYGHRDDPGVAMTIDGAIPWAQWCERLILTLETFGCNCTHLDTEVLIKCAKCDLLDQYYQFLEPE